MVATATVPMAVPAANLNLCWVGADGYTMTGRMELPDSKAFKTVVTQDDITAFSISGYLNGELIGSWDSAQRKSDSTWHLRYDPIGMTFLTGGRFASTSSQGWNADGTVENCGARGFGFNAGDYGQDICVNGVYIASSSVAPDSPLIATVEAVAPDCTFTPPVSRANSNFLLDLNQGD